VGLTVGTCYNHYMADSALPRSPFAGTINFYDGAPIRSISPEELARTLQAHELYVESNQRSGKRANLDSTVAFRSSLPQDGPSKVSQMENVGL